MKVLLDTMGIAHRAFYGGRPLDYDVTRHIGRAYRAACEDESALWSPADVIACVSAGRNWRLDLMPSYKSKRGPLPEGFDEQWRRLLGFLHDYGIRVESLDGLETDDVIAEFAKDAASVVISDDKDMMQLVRDDVSLWIPRRSELWRLEDVRKNFFFLEPRQIPHVQALAGDAADGIPGLPKIGREKAVWLVKQYGTLDGIYQHLLDGGFVYSRRVTDTLRNHESDARLFLRIATLGQPKEVCS